MANIKFYPEGIDLFTLSAVTSEATGFEKEYMLDRKKATYWKATSGAAQNIDIDLGADRSIDYVLIYADLDNGDTIQVFYDDNSGYTSPIQAGGSLNVTSDGWQFAKISFTAITSSDRYWRIIITPYSAAPSIALAFIGTEYEISCRYNKNQIDGEYDYSGNILAESFGGQRGASNQAEARRYWRFFYEDLDATNKAKLDSVISLTEGKRYPFVYSDTVGDNYFIRFMIDRLGMKQIEDQLYNSDEILLEEELGSPS